MSEQVDLGSTSITVVGGVECEVRFRGPADAFRSEMRDALAQAVREAEGLIDKRYHRGGRDD